MVSWNTGASGKECTPCSSGQAWAEAEEEVVRVVVGAIGACGIDGVSTVGRKTK